MSRRLDIVAWLYLAMAVLTGSMSLALLALWPQQVLLNPVVWGATAVVTTMLLAEAHAAGWRRSLLACLGATLLLGPGCGLSVYLFQRARSRAALAGTPAPSLQPGGS